MVVNWPSALASASSLAISGPAAAEPDGSPDAAWDAACEAACEAAVDGAPELVPPLEQADAAKATIARTVRERGSVCFVINVLSK